LVYRDQFTSALPELIIAVWWAAIRLPKVVGVLANAVLERTGGELRVKSVTCVAGSLHHTAWAPGFTPCVFRQGMKAAIIPADIAFRGGPRWHARGERFNADNE
jgi:hypothetical protein